MVDIEEVKILLGITGTTEDDIIRIIKNKCQNIMKAYLRTDIFPDDLDYIADELTIRRYTKLGVEGVQQESIMSSSTTKYILNDLEEYLWILDRYAEDNTSDTRVNRLTMM